MSSISISNIISLRASVINANTNTANLSINAFSENILIPASSRTVAFNNTLAVKNYFGATSDEYLFASKYFMNYVGASTVPREILFSRYVATDVSAYTFGQPVLAKQFQDLKVLANPAFKVKINGVEHNITITHAELEACTGLTDVAGLLNIKLDTALTDTTCTVIGNNQFMIASPAGVALSTIDYCGGNVATLLNLTQDTGAILSQGTVGGTPADNAIACIEANPNFLAFSYVTRLSGDTQDAGYPITIGLTAFIATQNYEYIGLWWEGGTAVSTTMWQKLVDAGYGVTTDKTTFTPNIQLDYNQSIQSTNQYTNNEVGIYSAFMGGMGAGVDYSQVNAKINFAGKTQAGLAPTTTTNSDYLLLMNRGYNVYGRFASKSANYDWSENGQFGGQFKWIDNIYDANWLFDAIINSCASLISNTKRIPYNGTGVTMVSAVVDGVANQGLKNGVIEAGNVFSPEQTQAIIQLVGKDITPVLTSAGYYIYFPPITPAQRNARAPLGFVFLYTNGGAVNGFDIGAVFVQ